MATFLDKLFGTGSAGFFSSLFGGGKGVAPTSTTKPTVLPPQKSRLEPVRGILEDMIARANQPPQSGVLPPPRALEKLPPAQIPIVLEDEDFLEPTTAPETAAADELSGYNQKDQHWLRSGEWLYVFSSNVSALRYFWPQRNLQVEYLSGAIYEYYGVEPQVGLDFTYALSPGRYRWHVLGDPRWGTVRYDYRRLKEPRLTIKKGNVITSRPKPRVAREVPNGLLNTIRGKRK